MNLNTLLFEYQEKTKELRSRFYTDNVAGRLFILGYYMGHVEYLINDILEELEHESN